MTGRFSGPVRKLAYVTFAFFGAALLSVGLLPQILLIPLGIVCALAAGGVLFLRRDCLRPILLLAGLAVGFLWCAGYQALIFTPSQALAGQNGQPFAAQVLSYPQATDYGWRFTARVETPGGPAVKTAIYLYQEESCPLVPGDNIEGAANFRSAGLSRGEAVFWRYAEGTYLSASLSEYTFTGHQNSLRFLPAQLSHFLQGRLDALYQGDPAGLYAALLTGEQSGLSTALRTSLARSGLSHMMAVSGAHLSLLLGVMGLFLRRRKIRLLCIPVLFFFVCMVNSPSASRAFLMALLALLAPLFRRQPDALTSLGLAAALLTALNPHAALSISLQLSLASVAGILLLTPRLYRRMVGSGHSKGHKALPVRLLLHLRRYALGGLAASLGALAFSLPLSAFYFNTISLISPLSALLVLWLLPLLMAVGICSALAAPIPVLGAWLALWGKGLASLTLWLIRLLGSLPFSSVTLDSVYLRVWLVFVYLLILLAALSPWLRRRWYLPTGCGALVLCAALIFTRCAVTRSDLTAKVLDVGQGECVLFLSGNEAAAVDCGGGSWDSAGDLLANELQQLGRSRLELLVITHFDSDHVNGVEELFARIQVERVMIPHVSPEENPWQAQLLAMAEEQGAQVITVEEDQTFSLPLAQLRIFAPEEDPSGSNAGLAALCTCGDFDLLVTGDRDADGERALLAGRELPDLEVLVAGHHGSATSACHALLKNLQPETAVISVGYNSYGHPSEETLHRLAFYGVRVYRTDLDGPITFQISH